MNIVDLGNWTEAFAGSPTVSSRLTLPVAMTLQEIQDMLLTIETTGAHGDLFLRAENDAANYAEFNMGGDQTGRPDAEVHEQELSALVESISIEQEDGADFNSNNIVSLYIYFVSSNVVGTASADETTIIVASSETVEWTHKWQEGFFATVQVKVDAGSSQVVLSSWPVDPQTGIIITKCLLVLADDVEREIEDFSGDPLGVYYGEPHLLEYVETSPQTGLVTANILQRGMVNPYIPINLGSLRRSTWLAEIPKGARCIMGLHLGLIEQGIREARNIGDQLVIDNEEWQEGIETDLAAWQVTTYDDFQDQIDTFTTAITIQQTDFETQQQNNFDNFAADQFKITGKAKEGDATKLVVSGGVWTDRGQVLAYAGEEVTPTLNKTLFYELEAGTSDLVSNEVGFSLGSFPVSKVVTDGAGIITVQNIGEAYNNTDFDIVAEIDKTDSPYTAIPQDKVILADPTAGAITINLPTAENAGQVFEIKSLSGDNAVTISPDGAETIDGEASKILVGQYQSITLMSDGTNWQVKNLYAGGASGGPVLKVDAYKSALQPVATFLAVTFPNEVTDVDDEWSSDTFTADGDGVRMFTFSLPIKQGNTATPNVHWQLFVNTAIVTAGVITGSGAANQAANMGGHVTELLTLEDGDTVELKMQSAACQVSGDASIEYLQARIRVFKF